MKTFFKKTCEVNMNVLKTWLKVKKTLEEKLSINKKVEELTQAMEMLILNN